MMEILIFLGIFVLWIVLQVWVLPRFGVKTWMTRGCGPSSARQDADQLDSHSDNDHW